MLFDDELYQKGCHADQGIVSALYKHIWALSLTAFSFIGDKVKATCMYVCQASVWYMCQASVWYKHDDTALITVNILKICFIGIHES